MTFVCKQRQGCAKKLISIGQNLQCLCLRHKHELLRSAVYFLILLLTLECLKKHNTTVIFNFFHINFPLFQFKLHLKYTRRTGYNRNIIDFL